MAQARQGNPDRRTPSRNDAGSAGCARGCEAICRQLEYRRGFGTLYTALYRPAERHVELIWPDTVWTLGVNYFEPAERIVTYQVPGKESAAPLPGRTGLYRRDA